MILFNSNLQANPTIIAGKQQWLIQRDGSKLFDTWIGAGTLIYGHNCETDHISIELLPEGLELGERFFSLIAQLVSFDVGGIGFHNSGSSAIARAVRLARAITGKSCIAVVGRFWHGSDDEFLFVENHSPASTGIPSSRQKEVIWFKTTEELMNYNNLGELAGILIEPNQGSDPETDLLKTINREWRKKFKEYGGLIIVDEIITGFRQRFGSCNTSRQLEPDIIVFGKACGLGYPIGLVVVNNKSLIMEKEIMPFWGGTHAAAPSQIRRIEYCLETLLTLDYLSITSNHRALIDFMTPVMARHGFQPRSGCGFSRAVNIEQPQKAREFLNKTTNFKNLQTELRDEGVYLANNGLFFPSVYRL
jgi:glutamate-1-semialdehyde aminotransferase